MALSDWLTAGTGSYAIVTDGTSPGTNTSIIQLTSSIRLYNVTAGLLGNSRIETYMRCPAVSHQINLKLYGNGTSTTAASSGSVLGDGYMFFIERYDPTNFLINISKSSSGVGINLISDRLYVPGTATNLWHRWRFGAYQTAGLCYLRAEHHNGVTWDVVMECASGDAAINARTGYACIESLNGNDPTSFDDTIVKSLS